jgi:hypothetical protein
MGSSGKIKLGLWGGYFRRGESLSSLSLHFFDDLDRVAICDIKRERAERMAKNTAGDRCIPITGKCWIGNGRCRVRLSGGEISSRGGNGK